MRIVSLLMCLTLIAGSLQAASTAIHPGHYIAEGGWGDLIITSGENAALDFNLQSVGGNAHTCNLEGRIDGTTATLIDEAGGPSCIVKFVVKSSGIQVISGAESCRNYCGVRGRFEGVYRIPPRGCDDVSRSKTRETFKQLYDRKQYRQALGTLSPLLTTCGPILFRFESGAIINDIAITQYKLGMREACLKSLAPYAEDAALSDSEIFENYPPADAESYLPIIKAARTNLRLCRKLKS